MVFLLLGCLTITYTKGPAEETRTYNHNEWHHRFANGMIEAPGPFDAGSVCPHGIAQVQTEVTVANKFASSAANSVGSAVGVDTQGLYDPSTIKVWCEAPKAADAPELV